MESLSCSGSISPFFSSTEKLRFFFEPVQLDFQLANLLVQLRDKILPLLVFFPSAIGKDPGKLLQELLSPLSDLIPMHSNFTGQLGDRLFSFHGLQGYLGLKGCPVGSLNPSPLSRQKFRG